MDFPNNIYIEINGVGIVQEQDAYYDMKNIIVDNIIFVEDDNFTFTKYKSTSTSL